MVDGDDVGDDVLAGDIVVPIDCGYVALFRLAIPDMLCEYLSRYVF